VVTFVLAEILFIADTELMIKRSSGLVKKGEGEWTFGQTLAMFMTILPLIETVKGLWGSYEERKNQNPEERTVSSRFKKSASHLNLSQATDKPVSVK
jgi:hypothetical protein